MKGTDTMSDANELWPEEGELLVCTVKGVKENGAYLNLNGYGEREGFVFIGEVAAGWVKNIRAHLREGQRVVAKVVNVKKDRQRVDLSIKAVSAERKKDTLQTWKNQQRASQIMRVAAERANWDAEKTEAISEEMIEQFGSLYGALEECAITETALADAGFSGEWMKIVTELAVENIVPPFVEIRGIYDIEVWGSEGVNAIRETLAAAESVVENEEEVTLTCHYDGAPHYRIDIRAPDYSLAESAWEAAKKIAFESANGNINPEDIDSSTFQSFTSLASYPKVDLLIRTSGEIRLSNFLLWDIAYSEFYFCETLWPDFDEDALDIAIKDFHSRDRRYGERNGER